MKKEIAVISIILLSLVSVGQVKDGYSIKIDVEGNGSSFLSIAYHMGDKQYIKDTIRTDVNGSTMFSGDQMLDQGLYMVVMPDNAYFEIIISDDQNFEISCSKSDFQGTLRFTGSEENSTFIAYQKGWRVLQDKSINIKQRLEANRESSDSLETISNELRGVEKSMVQYLNELSAEHNGTILSALLKAMLPVDIPDFEIPFDLSNPDSLRWVMGYTYNKDHFFDNIDLTDSRLIRTPVLFNKVNAFFNNVIIQHPDTIINEINRIVTLSEPDPQVFRFMIVYLFNHFRESQIMGHDAILVELADNYYLSGKADWVSEEFKDDLRKDVDKIRNNLIGNRAIELTMETFGGAWRSIYDLNNDFIILYFWEPNCGHCKTSTPLLREVYNRLKPEGVEVFAICTQGNREEWETYIVENNLEWINGWDPQRETHFDYYYNVSSTPMVYILNNKKEIIAKKLSVESIESFIKNYRKFEM